MFPKFPQIPTVPTVPLLAAKATGFPIAVGTLAVLGLMVGTASASTIYSDSFSGSSTTALNGAAPTVDNGTSATWTADAVWKANGSADESSSGSYGNAFLSFTPTAGHIYTLTEGVNATANSPGKTNSWIGLGFVSSEALGSPFYNNAGPFILDYVPNSGASVVRYSGPGLTNGTNYAYPATGVQNLQMVLDTGGASWTVQFSDNGTPLGSMYTYLANPTIGAVGFGTSNASGQVSNFSLTDVAVPEPATLGLVAIGGMGLLLVKRRRAV